mgnify:CR=1 FL=1
MRYFADDFPEYDYEDLTDDGMEELVKMLVSITQDEDATRAQRRAAEISLRSARTECRKRKIYLTV